MRGPPATNVKPYGVYRVLTPDDTLQATDLVRTTRYSGFGPHSDYIDHDGLKDLNWSLASERLPAWVGKTIRQFEAFGTLKWPYEYIRAVSNPEATP